MIAEVISIGDELTSGQRLDTNSQWLSERLGELGVVVRFHTTVADDLAANVLVFTQAIARADVVVATGGLGPTADDLTRDAVAQALGVELVLHEPSLAHIRGLFARHKREMPASNAVQAMLPAGSRPISNPTGTAPGIALSIPRGCPLGRGACHLFALPGVPAEMREMFTASVAPAIGGVLERPRVICHHRINCFGVGESQLEAMLPDLIRRGRQPAVGITVHAATITLRITAEGDSREQCLAAMQPTIATIRQCLADLIFGEEDEELPDVVVRLLEARGETLATAESATGGLLAHWLSMADEQRKVYRGGLVVSGGESPIVPAELLDDGLIGERGVRELAAKCREQFGATYGLAIGSFRDGPWSAENTPPRPYFFALATPDQVLVHSATLISHRSIWLERAAKQALNLLRLTLLRRA